MGLGINEFNSFNVFSVMADVSAPMAKSFLFIVVVLELKMIVL